jgi:glycogen debranching enzyme
MEDVIQIDDQWYILATSSRADDRTRVLKHGETFGVFDRYGDIQHIGIGEQGLYYEGTRFLSRYELSVNQRRPMLLNSTVKEDNSIMTVDLTTPDLYSGDERCIPKGTLHIFRSKLLYKDVQYEHFRLNNFGKEPCSFSLEFRFDADYSDIFEVRGVKREHSGQRLDSAFQGNGVCLAYHGLDDVNRYTWLEFSEQPHEITDSRVQLQFALQPHEQRDFYVTVSCQIDGERRLEKKAYDAALRATNEAIAAITEASGTVFSSNEQFNDWVNRSAADLSMLTTLTEYGPYPYAGVPWFSTPFGRDGIITALQYLWLYPAMARGVLAFLAATQADHHDAATDAEPGKILHEARGGEMAALGEIPFKRYYGTIDATPLFIILAGAYFQRTADRPFIESIWPNLEAALHWIDQEGDRDGDGFVEYFRESANGLVQQGWKDSNDSVFHRDGRAAEGPIALCEVQAYVYEAKKVMADFAQYFGEPARAEQLRSQAARLKKQFNQTFWCDDIDTYALALDGDKQPCAVASSNAGHVLYCGIASKEYAGRAAKALMSKESFSGWGVRTLARGEANFNPMSYHNGSIWPHDNALIAAGLARYGYKDEALRIFSGLFDCSLHIDLHRLPELFCGFERIPGQAPTLYPVACSPQAWASGTVFCLLQACLGLSFSADKPQIRFRYPRLPDSIQRLDISNLRFGHDVVDLALRRHGKTVTINVTRKEGDIDIAVIM